MNKTIMAITAAMLITTSVLAQKQTKPWKEWTRKDAEKILNDSPWSQTQTETESSQATETGRNFGDTRGREEAVTSVAGSASVKFHVRFYSARPVRQAYVRMIELSDTPPDQAAAERMNAWANLAADDRIIVAVSFEGSDKRYLSRVARAFSSSTTPALKDTVYLERKDGKRVFLSEYVPPSKDAFGARFIFPRTVDGQPFITPDSSMIRFHAEYDPKIPDASKAVAQASSTSAGSTTRTENPFKLKLDMKFKVAEMNYNGELEY